ncbi:MAG: hypothetical protein ACLQPH_06225 [Acidimicrobiales bacterium]
MARAGGWALGVVGIAAVLVAFGVAPPEAIAASSQVWSPFVLVAGLLMVGLVAVDDGLFGGAAVTIALVTTLLNLDTSVVFLTPILVHAARARGQEEAPLVMGTLLLSNAASLLLPGSNLTNLIVLGQLHLAGTESFRRTALPWLATVVVTGLTAPSPSAATWATPAPGGLPARTRAPGADRTPYVAVVGAVVSVLALQSPATRRRDRRGGGGRPPGRQEGAVGRVLQVLGLPVLVGLFAIDVALGTLGRTWAGPSVLLAHLDGLGTAALAAGASVLVDNLPAASVLAARVPPHPYALLNGLDIGPNLLVTGSLGRILCWRTARTVGSPAPVARTRRGGSGQRPAGHGCSTGRDGGRRSDLTGYGRPSRGRPLVSRSSGGPR